uniref:RWD domain-containing protein n=1 Tax=Tetradesmus obliquus TaxID=3088 RepID=A0A383W0K8_TETOB|eukprot:jgi/Sobl393_1/11843/SZX70633.1
MSSDKEAQAEERESLHAIYDADCEYDADACSYKVYLPSKNATPLAVLRALLPAAYPSAVGPVLELDAPHLPQQQLVAAVAEMEAMFCPGDVCLFTQVEWLREQLQQWQEEEQQQQQLAAALQASLALAGSSGGSSSSSEPGSSSHTDDELDDALHHLPESSERQQGRELPGDGSGVDAAVMLQMRGLIISGEPYMKRKSTFQAHVAPITQLEQVKAVVAVLLESNKIRNATHNIMAYRIAAPGKPGVFYQDFDDDGEAAAGGRLLHLLQVADVQNAVVVVSRWFGGILLGPARFGLINNTARQLLEQTGFIQHGGGSSGQQGGSKKGHKKKH